MSIPRTTPTTATTSLPQWASVLAVVAHPDDESFGLGAVLDAFVQAGATVTVLCLTQGEASTIHGVSGDLAELRAAELRAAARELGVSSTILKNHPDGHLDRDADTLVREVVDAAIQAGAQGLVVLDPSGVTGHPDHIASTTAALKAAEEIDLPALGWTIPTDVAERLNTELDATFLGHPDGAIDIHLLVDRAHQLAASLAHASQAIPTSLLWRRLELLGNIEHLRWLRHTQPRTAPVRAVRVAAVDPAAASIRVDHQAGDRFDIVIRDHTVTTDQPEVAGGDDTGPTPTELFVGSIASCVAFYARRYLARHHIDAEGLSVEASYELDTKPARVAGIEINLQVPPGLSQARREALLAVAGHCTVHNSITIPPTITLGLASP